jgi:hypothetical protein
MYSKFGSIFLAVITLGGVKLWSADVSIERLVNLAELSAGVQLDSFGNSYISNSIAQEPVLLAAGDRVRVVYNFLPGQSLALENLPGDSVALTPGGSRFDMLGVMFSDYGGSTVGFELSEIKLGLLGVTSQVGTPSSFDVSYRGGMGQVTSWVSPFDGFLTPGTSITFSGIETIFTIAQLSVATGYPNTVRGSSGSYLPGLVAGAERLTIQSTVAIPEPSTCAVIVGFVVFGFALAKNSKSKIRR